MMGFNDAYTCVSRPLWMDIHCRSTLHVWFQAISSLRPIQNERHFADDIFKCIFFNENVWISIQISLKFVPKGPINNIPALIRIMAWRRQTTSHYLNQWWLNYRRIYASLGLNELKESKCWLELFRKKIVKHESSQYNCFINWKNIKIVALK